MFICKKRVVTVDFAKRYIRDNQICVGVPANAEYISKIELDVLNGETSIVPSPRLGINCCRNAEGEWITDKTSPKELRLVNTVHWTWHQWAPGGGTEIMSDWCDVYKQCYPKRYIKPDCIEVKLLNQNDKKFLASTIKIRDFESCKKLIRQTVNMYLELFGCCYIYDKEFKFDAAAIKKCQWEFLPAGEKIWVSEQVREAKTASQKTRDDFYQYRIDIINAHIPQKVYVGSKGFAGYYAFIFGDYCVFENGLYGNATYITSSVDWETLSQMTKRQLLDSENVIKRFVHESTWEKKITVYLKSILNSA